MRKKEIRQDMGATAPATSADPAGGSPATNVSRSGEVKLEVPTGEPLKTAATKLEIPQVEAVQIDLPKLEAAILETPKVEASQRGQPESEAARLATKPEEYGPPRDAPGFEPPRPDGLKFDPLRTAAAFRAKEAIAAAATAEAARSRTNRFPLLAASVALAAAFGAVLGSLAMAGVAKLSPTTTVAATPATAATPVDAAPASTVVTRTVTVVDPQWKETIARVRADIAALKAEIEASNRAVSAHFAKIDDRFDRTERAAAEPAKKIARIIETLDRIELRTTAAGAAAAAVSAPTVTATATAPAAAAPPAASATPDTTGSIASDGRPKPPVVDGWVLRQVFDGFALIEGFNGRLFEVGPGSNIPGIGRVETIRRQEGQWVVVTPKGIITR